MITIKRHMLLMAACVVSSPVLAQSDNPRSSNYIIQTDTLLQGISEQDLDQAQRLAKEHYSSRWPIISERSRFVRHRVLDTIEKMGAPRSLQLVPVIESTYSPYALSHAGALGLWQIMPGTAKSLGLKSDKKKNGRRDINRSTETAIQYLMKLHDRFDSWPLALAGYNLGPNAVSRRLKKQPWDVADGLDKLPIPKSTRIYVKHAIGLAVLFNEHTFELPQPIKTKPLHLNAPIDIEALARISGMEKQEIFHLNPSLNQAQYLREDVTIYVPDADLVYIQSRLKDAGPKFVHTTVKNGDSLWSIARTFGTSTKAIKRLNKKTLGKYIKSGQKLKIPANRLAKATASENPLIPSKRRIRYKVRSGDSLWGIASRFGTTAKAIAKVNRLSQKSIIRAGDIIWVLGQGRSS